jgi:hypothetical protein
MNLQSSTLETGEPLHVQQREQIEAYRDAWREAGHRIEPRISVSGDLPLAAAFPVNGVRKKSRVRL